MPHEMEASDVLWDQAEQCFDDLVSAANEADLEVVRYAGLQARINGYDMETYAWGQDVHYRIFPKIGGGLITMQDGVWDSSSVTTVLGIVS